ncbi:MAG: glycosyltransferase family 2 protein [Planctomycetota bacterium]|nr:MAG: glycosyltransferase family 2 protein [Planctomycetota bacterium]
MKTCSNSQEREKLKTILVAPALNEEGKIGNVVRRAKNAKVVDKILVVDDGSEDNTRQEAEREGAVVLSHPHRRGVGAAIRTGIDYALKHGYEVVVIIAGDDQDEPEEIPRLLEKIHEGYDFVQGSRYLQGERTRNMTRFRKFATRLYPLIFRLFTGFPCTDGTNGFRAFRTSIFQNKRLNLWQKWLDTYELEPYLFYMVVQLGYKVVEVPVTKTYHIQKGYTKMTPFRDWWRILRPLFFLKFRIKR